ncbi:ABC transporter substrate-binding protein [bacterium]|nr:MAG: ABC transporter substrate-binding protein [bacterium]
MRHFTKLVAGVLALAMTFAGLAVPTAASAETTVTVGAVFPLTGSLAAFGKTSVQGLQLAAKEINDRGGIAALGGAKINLVVRDTTSDPADAANATARLIDDVHPIAVVGAYASSLSLTSSSVCERRGIPFLTMSFTDDLTSRGYKYTFQVVPKASVIGSKQLNYAVDIAKAAGDPLKSIAIVYENTAYGTSQAKGLQAEAETLHVHVSLFEAYPHGLTDATPLVQKINASNAQVLFPISYFTDAVLMIRALAQSHSKVQIVGGAAGFVIPEFVQTLGSLTENIMSIDTSAYDQYGPFEKAYMAAYHTFAPHEAYENAVSLFAIAAALQKSRASSSEELRNALASLDVKGGAFAGMPGSGVKFNANGLNEDAYPVMVQWRNHNLVTIWPASSHGVQAAVWNGKTVK